MGTVLTNVLLYHVISGAVLSTDLSDGLVADTLLGGQNTVTASLRDDTVGFYSSFGGKSLVSTADVVATNGVIHIIDAVLLPGGTVANVTAGVEELSSLDGALAANGLKSALNSAGANYTLFAPSNDAVAAFNGVIDTQLLLYHVVATRFLSTEIPVVSTPLPTLNSNGTEVTVINNGTGVFVRDVTNRTGEVTTANINSVNGVVHIIDIVLDDTTA